MYVSLEGVDFFYLKHGNKQAAGVPLLVVHGGPGLDHTYLRPWLDSLGDDNALIYRDALGCGKSAGKEHLAKLSLAGAVQQLEALRQHLKLPRVVLLAHGFGGFTAQAYALAHPEHTAGLILCNTAPAFDYPEAIMANIQSMCAPPLRAAVVSMLSARVSDDESLRRLYSAVLPLYFYRYDPKIGAAMTEVMKFSAAHYNHELFDWSSELTHLPAPHAWEQLRMPCLLLAGQHDWLMPPQYGAARLQQLLPHGSLTLFEESGHFPFIEEPVAFYKIVRHWLRQHDLRR